MHQVFSQHFKKRKRSMHQIFNICWQMISCWFMLLMPYLPLLDICGEYSHYPKSEHMGSISQKIASWAKFFPNSLIGNLTGNQSTDVYDRWSVNLLFANFCSTLFWEMDPWIPNSSEYGKSLLFGCGMVHLEMWLVLKIT